MCCDCDLSKPTTQEKKYFLSKKRSKAKNIKYNDDFRKVVISKHRMRYAIYISPNTKDLAINPPMVAYGNRQNVTALARANDSDLLRLLKHLMQTSMTDVYLVKI